MNYYDSNLEKCVQVYKSNHSAYLWTMDSDKGYWDVIAKRQYDRNGTAFKTYDFDKHMKAYYSEHNIKTAIDKAYILQHLYVKVKFTNIYEIKTGGERSDTFDVYYLDKNGEYQFIYHNEISRDEATRRGLKNYDKLRKKYHYVSEWRALGDMKCYTEEVDIYLMNLKQPPAKIEPPVKVIKGVNLL